MKQKKTLKGDETTWYEGVPKDEYPVLAESFETDVCVIGGGLAGMLSAYLIHKAGLRVAIAEKKTLGGVTGLTTAFLTASIDTQFADLIRSFGPEGARMIASSHTKAIDLIESIVRDESIQCDFKRCSNYLYASTENGFSMVEEEYDAALTLGLNASLERSGSKLAFKNWGYMELKDQAKFHPLKFLFGLAKILSEEGVKIFERTEAKEVLDRDFGYAVRARGHSIQAKWVISATYEPHGEPLRLYFKKGMYKTYILEARTEWKIPEGTYEDTDNPYHYMRVDENGTGYKLLVGGADHREDVPLSEEKSFGALESYLESIIPKESFSLMRRWTGPILEPIDGLAFIGPMQKNKNMLYAFAFSGNGMTYSGIAAIMLRDHVLGKKNPWNDIYRADRLPHLRAFFTKGKNFAEELARGVAKNALSKKSKLKDVLPKKKEE